MAQKYSGLILLGLLSFISCEKEVYIPIPGYDSKPVVYGIAKENDSLKILISQTYSSYDTAPIFSSIKALIGLYVNGAFIENLTPEDSFYIAKKYTPQKNDIINLDIVTDKGDKVTTKTFIPAPINIDTLIYKPSGNAEDYSEVLLRFKDAPFPDFYEIQVEAVYTDSTKNIFLTTFKSTDPILADEESIGEYASNLFSDKLFDTKEVTLHFSIPNFNYNSSQTPRLLFHLNHITEDYYKFLKTFYKQSSSSDLFNLKSEPVNVYTNMNGGYGIFTGLTTSTDTLK
jgi:hypothetical protein